MKRLIEKIVFSGLVMAWRLATWPTSLSPLLVNATTEGVVRAPSSFGMTFGSPPSMTATHELVVPRSIPMILAMLFLPLSEDPDKAGSQIECLTVNLFDANFVIWMQPFPLF